MITIIFAPPRTGKTALMTHFLNTAAFDRQRTNMMKNEIARKNAAGFKLTAPQHCVCANYEIICRKFGYTPRLVNRINPFLLGFDNLYVKTHFLPPYSVIGITEGQKYFNSRMAMYYPDWQSRWFEQSGHDDLDIYIDVQRPGLIDVNIRDLASFIEIVKKEPIIDHSRIVGTKWQIRRIDSNAQLETYLSSGKKDRECFRDEEVVINYNVHRLYDSQNCKPRFYAGHFKDDFDMTAALPPEESLDGYIKYIEELDDELPIGFYKKRSL